MDKRLERIEDKLDKVLEKAASTDVTLAEQAVTLKEHMRRTELLEGIVMPIKTKVDTATVIAKIIAGMIGAGGLHSILHYLVKLY